MSIDFSGRNIAKCALCKYLFRTGMYHLHVSQLIALERKQSTDTCFHAIDPWDVQIALLYVTKASIHHVVSQYFHCRILSNSTEGDGDLLARWVM